MKKIELGSIEFPIKLGTKFLQNITTAEQLTVSEIITKYEKDPLVYLPKLIFHSINTALLREGKDSIEEDVVCDWFDEVGVSNSEVKNFTNAFNESIMIHVPQDKEVGKPKAKKP